MRLTTSLAQSLSTSQVRDSDEVFVYKASAVVAVCSKMSIWSLVNTTEPETGLFTQRVVSQAHSKPDRPLICDHMEPKIRKVS